jgi:hypothetical protein
MKLLSNSNLLSFFCVIVISFSCSKKEKQTIKTLGKATVVLAKNFSKLDVCGCNEQGNLILDSSITIMKPLKNIKNLRNSNAEKIEMRSLLDRWSALMSSCFKKHGANMWVFSDCNDLETITEKKDTLYNLGIQIDRGDLLKL